MVIFFVVLIFSIVQSIFGVGLLLFGTPTLLLLGVSFNETLWTLLPSSIFISIYQIVGKYSLINSKNKMYLFTLPPIVIGLILVLSNSELVDIKKVVGLFLLVVSGIRLSKWTQKVLRHFIVKHINIYCILMGLVHGISNMGGGALTVLMSSLHDKKEVIRVNIAFVYLLFASIQIITLYFVSPHIFSVQDLLLIVTSGTTYFLVNRYIVLLINDNKFQVFITYLILFYGVLAIGT